jgi:acetyl esterase/lipase
MDSVGAHIAADVLVLTRHCYTAAIVFPAHTITIFQALDLWLLSAFRIRKRTAQGDFCSKTAKDHIIKELCAYEEACASFNIRGCLGRAGFTPDSKTTPFRLVFGPDAVRNVG